MILLVRLRQLSWPRLTRRQWVAGLALFALFLGLLLPLSVALPRIDGVTARRASGTIWSGRLLGLAIGDLPLGDTRVGLRLFPLFWGQTHVGFVAPTLLGVVRRSSSTIGLDAATGSIDAGTAFAPLPIGRIELDAVSVLFRAGRCARAEGRVRATIAGDVGGLVLPGGLSGTVRCDGTALLIPLVGQSGMERLTLRIGATGWWRAQVLIRSSDPAITTRLSGSGFVPRQGGYALDLSGRL